MSQPLIARGISTRYITSESRLIVDDLLAGNRELFYILPGLTPLFTKFSKKKVNEAMEGSDMIGAKKKKKQKQLVVSKEDFEEERVRSLGICSNSQAVDTPYTHKVNLRTIFVRIRVVATFTDLAE